MELINRSIIGRTLRHLGGQATARNNAADASAALRKRRWEREEAEAFVHAHRRAQITSGARWRAEPSPGATVDELVS